MTTAQIAEVRRILDGEFDQSPFARTWQERGFQAVVREKMWDYLRFDCGLLGDFATEFDGTCPELDHLTAYELAVEAGFTA